MPVECAGTGSKSHTTAQSAEVSGWDADGQFFVEIAELDVSDSGSTTARLCHRLNSGSLVFVRLLHGYGDGLHEKGYPTAHEAHAAEPPDFSGRCRIRLTPCQPRLPRRLSYQKTPTRI